MPIGIQLQLEIMYTTHYPLYTLYSIQYYSLLYSTHTVCIAICKVSFRFKNIDH